MRRVSHVPGSCNGFSQSVSIDQQLLHGTHASGSVPEACLGETALQSALHMRDSCAQMHRDTHYGRIHISTPIVHICWQPRHANMPSTARLDTRLISWHAGWQGVKIKLPGHPCEMLYAIDGIKQNETMRDSAAQPS